MKMRLDAAGSLIQTLSVLKENKMPFKTVYKLTKLMESAETQMKFYNDQVNKILNEYIEKDETGNFISEGTAFKIKEGLTEEANSKYDELNTLLVDYADVTFDIEELENLNLTMTETHILMPFLN